MRCFIAIDSGGTKTDAVLFEETGHILARSLTQGCNAMDIGIGSACESLLGVLQNLVARIPRDGTLVSIYSGVAATDYFGGELGRYIRPYFPDVTMRFEDDAVKQVKIGAYLNRYANMNPIIDMIKELNLVDIKQREGVLHISYK